MRRQSDGADFGAWLFKCNPRNRDFERFLTEARGVREWCAARNYRATLIRSGQPVMLWVSGGLAAVPVPGIWAVGETASSKDSEADIARAIDRPTPETRAKSQVGLALRQLDEPIPRTVLRQVSGLERMEVLRIPAGSNPSWVTRAELEVLRGLIDVPWWPGEPELSA
jgi:hypothetical protein